MTSTKSSVHLAPISAVYALEKLSTLRQKIKKEETLRELVERALAGKAKGCSLRRPIGLSTTILPAAVPVLALDLPGSSLVLQPLQLLLPRSTFPSAVLLHTSSV